MDKKFVYQVGNNKKVKKGILHVAIPQQNQRDALISQIYF